MRRTALRVAILLLLFAAALGSGYALSTTLGRQLLRDEAEVQMTALFRAPCEVGDLRLRFGLGFELVGTRVRVEYPAAVPGQAAGSLSAQEVVLRLETSSLLLGRFEVDVLEVDGLELDLHSSAQGTWSPPYFRKRSNAEKRPEERGEYDGTISWLTALIDSGHFLLDEQKIADRIELRNASLRFNDGRPSSFGADPVRIVIEDIDGSLERGWLPGRSDLSLRGRIPQDAGKGRGPGEIEIVGRRTGSDEPLELNFAVSDFELDALRPYLNRRKDREESVVDGRFSGILGFISREKHAGEIEVDWSVDQLRAAIPMGESQLSLRPEAMTLRARLQLNARRFRIDEARFEGPALTIETSGSIERPLAPRAVASLRSSLAGLNLDELRRLARGLPKDDAGTLLRMLEPVRSGSIPLVSARGRLALRELTALLGGELSGLPESIELRAELRDVSVASERGEGLSGLSAEVSWSGDRFELRDARATLAGEPLPKMDLAVDGVSTLLAAAPTKSSFGNRARPLPGLSTLWEVLRGDGNGDGKTEPIVVEVDELDHPALRWPLRDARIEIDPNARDLHVRIPHGHWAGSPVSGEAVLVAGAAPELRAELRVAKADSSSEHLADVEPDRAASNVDATTWASGRFASVGVHGGPLRFEQITGTFAVRGQTLLLGDVGASLEGGGSLEGSASFGLDRSDAVQSSVSFEIDGAEASRVAAFFGLPDDFATGRADLEGRLVAPLRPETSLIRELVGEIDIRARKGKVRQNVPLLAALAHASEGFSAAKASSALRYERIDAAIRFDRGRVSSDRIALEGPLRVLAVGDIDFRSDAAPVNATVGLFALRQADRLLGNIPIVKLILPGGDRGLLGAYFQVSGPVAQPKVEAMPMKSLAEGTPLPEVLRGPFRALGELLSAAGGSEKSSGASSGNLKRRRAERNQENIRRKASVEPETSTETTELPAPSPAPAVPESANASDTPPAGVAR